MKKIFMILFIILFKIFFINFAEANSDRWWWNDRPAPIYRANLKVNPSTNLDVSFNYDWNCSQEVRDKYWEKESIPWNFSKVNVSWTLCSKNSDWSFNCRITWSRITWNGPEQTINRETNIFISNNDLFNTWSLPINLSWNLIQKINLELRLDSSRFLWITEWDSIFNAVFNHKIPDQKASCHISCRDECVKYEEREVNWNKKMICVKYEEESSISCNWWIENKVIDPIPSVKTWVTAPEITKVELSWSNCKWNSCYAWENFEIKIGIKEWNPSWVSVVRTYVLNKDWTNCYKDVKSWECPFTDLWLTWWILKTDWLKKVWDYQLEFNAFVMEWWKVINKSEPKYINIKIVPNPEKLTWYIKSENKKDKTNNKIYANYKDSYEYKIQIKDKYENIINNKKILTLECKDNCINDKNSLKWVNTKDFIKKTNNKWETNFKIVSAVPNHWWNDKPSFSWTVEKWAPNYKYIKWESPLEIWNSLEAKIFEEPITYDNVIIEWNNINVTKNQRYDIKLKNEWSLNDFSNWKVFDINKTNITLTSWYEFKNFIKNEIFWNKIINWIWFKASVIALQDEKIKKNIDLFIKNLKISYNLNKWSKIYSIEYPLRWLNWFKWCEVKTTWLIINWISNSKWKEKVTSDLNTFSNISRADLKKIVEKNANDLTRWVKNWEKVNWVLFYDKQDVNYSQIKNKLSNNETLIVKNWNLFIDENIIWNIWIIILSDKFIPDPENSKWNIFVKNTVSRINAYLYAEWWFISAKSLNWKSYTDDELRISKLDIKWSLFSSNTVWGWEKWNNYCQLPLWWKITNCELAERYDLNYIRKHIIKCEEWISENENYSFKIEYNPKIQTNPPKWFTK